MNGVSISERQQLLLRTLVGLYIRGGQPVGSRTLVQHSGVSVSPATVRALMADLESRGYVATPHTSAGRVPTAKGYRFFIDTLITMQPLPPGEIEALKTQLGPDKTTQELLAATSNLLSVITHQAGLVTVPRQDEVTLRHVEFLPLAGSRVLVILVLNEKEVQNRIIHTEREYEEHELRAAANFVNAHFTGRGLDAIRDDLLSTLHKTRKKIDGLLEAAMDIASRALVTEDRKKDAAYVVRGQSHLLDAASADNMKRLRELFEAFQQQKDILHLMERSARADGVQIFIGEEAGYEPLVDFSLVTAPYQDGGRTVGVIGVIGPTRMAYDRVIPVVDVTARMLTAALRA
ncbi:MAG: Heat-inducible transcription repressor HrcA [Pseudomonadales bacterium]|nr:Heat-inducible transcription repressor HrcA [Pseudomonadales bacterium]